VPDLGEALSQLAGDAAAGGRPLPATEVMRRGDRQRRRRVARDLAAALTAVAVAGGVIAGVLTAGSPVQPASPQLPQGRPPAASPAPVRSPRAVPRPVQSGPAAVSSPGLTPSPRTRPSGRPEPSSGGPEPTPARTSGGIPPASPVPSAGH
jgi:hypothetical protein